MKENSKVRVFKSDFWESLTHVHPIMPLVVWVPVILFWLWRSYNVYQLSALEFLVLAGVGLLVWTLTEYLLHRFMFHFRATGQIGRRFVFMFHGLHHDEPECATRLVMPPVPAVLIVTVLYNLFSLVVPNQYMLAFMAFFMSGYLCYDYIHYATHHFAMTSKVGRFLRSYHLKHHFSHEASKFGVSNPLWDYVFRTVEGPPLPHESSHRSPHDDQNSTRVRHARQRVLDRSPRRFQQRIFPSGRARLRRFGR